MKVTKRFLFTGLLFLACMTAGAQSNSKYDKHLADSLGGDEYGMKPYILVLLKTGSSQADNKEIIDSLFKGHMANMQRLVSIGKLIVAGPLKSNDKNYRGIFILNVKTKEEAGEILGTDPAIREHLLDAEIYQWYGAAALPLYLNFQENVTKQKM